MKILSLILLGLLSHMAGAGREIARGHVYEDLNGNGKRDRNEAGVASVGVSNGSDITLTDAQGYYELPVAEGHVIFVIKPSDYAFPQDENHMPRYYYIHKPSGSPPHYKFRGVAPTGKLPQPLDFALHASPEPDSFTALVFGDPQVRNRRMLEFYEQKIVSELVDSPGIAFGMSMGDVSDEDLDLMGPIGELTARIGVPWHYVNGNHDTNYDAGSDILSNETFIRYFGPPNYSFNYGQAHVLVIDDIYHPNPQKPDEQRWASMYGLRDDQWAFIRNDLACVEPDRLVVLALHVPLHNLRNYSPGDVDFLLEQLSRFEHVLVIASHMHCQYHMFYGPEEGWKSPEPLHEFVVGTTCGSWYSGFPDEHGIPESRMTDGTPQGYAYLHVEGNRYALAYKVAGQPSAYQMEILNPRVVIRGRHTPAFITANFFMGHETDRVEFRIDDGEWKPMEHIVMPDPYYQNRYYQWGQADTVHTTRWPSAPTPCSHIWRTPVPANVPVGERRIEVRATDRYGHTHHGRSSYRVAEPLNNDYP